MRNTFDTAGEHRVDVANSRRRIHVQIAVGDVAQQNVDALECSFRLAGEYSRSIDELSARVVDGELISAPLIVRIRSHVRDNEQDAEQNDPAAQALGRRRIGK